MLERVIPLGSDARWEVNSQMNGFPVSLNRNYHKATDGIAGADQCRSEGNLEGIESSDWALAPWVKKLH